MAYLARARVEGKTGNGNVRAGRRERDRPRGKDYIGVVEAMCVYVYIWGGPYVLAAFGDFRCARCEEGPKGLTWCR